MRTLGTGADATRDGLQAAAAKGRRPGRPQLEEETISSALALIEAGLPPARAARQLGIGRSTLYREDKGDIASHGEWLENLGQMEIWPHYLFNCGQWA